MGIISAEILLSNPRNRVLHPVIVRALADTGALHLCIPEHIAIQQELEELYRREVTTADGGKHLCAYVGPVEVTMKTEVASRVLWYWAMRFY